MRRKSEFVGSKLLLISLATSAIATLLTILPTYAQTTSSSTYGPFPCVSTDPRANASANGFPIPSTCQQYFGVGAAFSAALVSGEAKYYGVAIPALTSGNLINTGVQPNPDDFYYGASTSFITSPSFDAVQYNYCPTNSRNGREVFLGLSTSFPSNCLFTASTSGGIVTPNNPGTTAIQSFPTNASSPSLTSPLFAFSVTPLSTEDLSTYASSKLPSRGNPIQIPVATSNIVVVTNRAVTTNGGSTNLNLSASDLCHVFDGSYTNYGQLGGGASDPSRPLKVIVRSDDSGMTFVLTSYLAALCNSNNPTLNLPVVTRGFTGYYLLAGNSIFPQLSPTASFLRVPGDAAIVNTVATTTGGLGYTAKESIISTLTTSSGAPLPLAAYLQNPVSPYNYVYPNHTPMKYYLRNINLTPNATYPCVLTLTGTTTIPTDSGAYPLTTPSYLLLYSKYPTQIESDAARGLFHFMLLNTFPTNGNTSYPPGARNDLIAQIPPLDSYILRKSPGNTTISYPDTNALRATERACVNSIVGP
jgi:ABC-type phosphate transport system substrate-binding protein